MTQDFLWGEVVGITALHTAPRHTMGRYAHSVGVSVGEMRRQSVKMRNAGGRGLGTGEMPPDAQWDDMCTAWRGRGAGSTEHSLPCEHITAWCGRGAGPFL